MQDLAGSGLTCSASDIEVASISDIVIVDSCDYPGDTATLDMTAEFTLTTQARHDLGIFISTDGGNALTGTCSVSTIPVAPDPPYVDLDGTDDDPGGVISDTCGDIDAAHSPISYTLTGIIVQCIDEDGDGEIEVNAGLAWRQPGANELCTSPLHAYPGAPSKCNVQQLPNLTVPVPGRIVVDKLTDPADDPTIFGFILAGGPDTVTHPFTLTGQTEPFDSASAGLILRSGVYSVTETVPPLWELTSATCTGGRDPSAIDLAPGETVTCTFTDTILAAPSLVLTKEISADTIIWFDHITVALGADVYYRFTVENTGNVPVTGTAITDPNVNASGCAFADPLSAGQTTTCTIGPVGALEGLHTNTAHASADYGAQTYRSSDSSASYFAAAPSLTLTKMADRDIVRVGETVTFTIRVTNTGNTTITSLSLVDAYDPSHLTLTSWSLAPDGHYSVTGAITWTSALSAFLPLAPDDSISITIDFRAEASTTPGVTTNGASAQGVDEYGYGGGREEDSADVRVVDPGIALVKALTEPPQGVAIVGDTVTFTLYVTNTGNTTITSLSLIDTYDPGYLTLTSYDVSPDGHDAATGIITWTSALDSLLPLPPDEGLALAIDFRAEASTVPGTTRNAATARGQDEYGYLVGPDEGRDTVQIAEPGIALVKELADPPSGIAVVGDTVTFTIHITNTGNTTITSLSLIDAYDPTYLILTSGSVTPDDHDPAAGTITWTSALNAFLPLAPDEGFIVMIDLLARASTAPTVTSNLAIVHGEDEHGHLVGPEESSADVTITEPAIVVVKTLTDPLGGVAVVSDTITFTIRITNTGDTTITSLTITDTYDSCMVMTSADPEPAYAGLRVFLPLVLGQAGATPRSVQKEVAPAPTWLAPVVWHMSDPLSPGASTVITVDFHAESTDPACANWVEVTAEDEYGHPVGPERGEDDVRIIQPDVAILKTLVEPQDGVAVVADTVTFTIRLTNTGDTTITQVTIVDTYNPAYLTLTSHSETPNTHDANTGVITWTDVLSAHLPLAPGEEIVLTIDFSANASTMPSVTSNVVVGQGVDEYGHAVGPVEDEDHIRITEPGIAVLKELTDPATGTVEAGETVTFTIRITNTGDTAITSLVVTDGYDADELTLTSWSVAPDAHNASTGVITWTGSLDGYLPLAPDEAIALTIDFRADEPTTPDVTTNTVAVRGRDEYGHPVGPEDSSANVEIIPLELVSVRLRYYWYPIDPRPPEGGRIDVYPRAVQEDLRVEGTLAADAQMVMILDQNGDWLETLETHSSDARTWFYSEHDLIHYGGETIWLYFGVYNDGNPADICSLSMYVDEVSLEACYGSQPVCMEIVVNGGFEVDEAWYFPVTEYPAGYSRDRSYRGSRSMLAGILDWREDTESYSSGWQLVTIPLEWVP